jgi:hypothetical protein
LEKRGKRGVVQDREINGDTIVFIFDDTRRSLCSPSEKSDYYS